MEARIDYMNSKILQDVVKRINATSAAVPKGTLPPGLANLVLRRASQINGCAMDGWLLAVPSWRALSRAGRRGGRRCLVRPLLGLVSRLSGRPRLSTPGT